MEANSVLLQKKYARIVALFAEQMQVTLDAALEFSIAPKLIRNCATESLICIVEAISISWMS